MSVKVLLVDDVADERLFVQDLLDRAEGSFDLEWVSDYELALERLVSGDHDVCLLDYALGQRTGFDLLREIKDYGCLVPVILLTGVGSRILDLKASELGAVDYLDKGEITPQMLERAIRYAVRTSEAIRALRDSEEKYALTVRGANDGLWDWSLRTNTITFGSRWKAMFGYEDAEIGDDPSEWFDRIHPEDRKQVEAAIDDHIHGITDHFESVHRMCHADGSYRWVLVRAQAARGPDGEAYRIAGSHMDITKLRELENQLLDHSFFDEVTGLPNLNLLLDRAALAVLNAASSKDRHCAMLVARVDATKSVALTLGRSEGERFIAEVASRMLRCVRSVDTMAHLGEGEFGILVTGIDDIGVAVRIAERLQAAMAQPVRISNVEVATSITVGIAMTDGDLSGDDLFRQASAALAQPAASGRDRIRIFDRRYHARSVVRMQFEADLRRDVDAQALTVFYQPIVSLASGRIVAFEALVRWPHRERGLLAPDDFVPLAEEIGIIRSLDLFVLETAARQLAGWHREFETESSLAIAVNWSGRHFVDPEIVSLVRATLVAAGIEGSLLHLELTESVLLEQPELAISIFDELAEEGVSIMVDDFGTGFSSLSYLQRLPVSALKIDRSFVRALTTGEDKIDIVRWIIELARDLGITTIAEGVESQEQLRHLRELGCDQVQGFLLGVPVDSAAATALIADQVAGVVLVEPGVASEDEDLPPETGTTTSVPR